MRVRRITTEGDRTVEERIIELTLSDNLAKIFNNGLFQTITLDGHPDSPGRRVTYQRLPRLTDSEKLQILLGAYGKSTNISSDLHEAFRQVIEAE